MKSFDKNQYLHQDLTDKIIKVFYEVYNILGVGFLESVYKKAMEIELLNNNLTFEIEKPLIVHYKNEIIGNFYADMIVNDLVILELKAVDILSEIHEVQLVNYLRATDKEVGLLLNFGKKPEIKRKAFTNDRKYRK